MEPDWTMGADNLSLGHAKKNLSFKAVKADWLIKIAVTMKAQLHCNIQ